MVSANTFSMEVTYQLNCHVSTVAVISSSGTRGHSGWCRRETGFEASLGNVQHDREETRLHLCNGAALGLQVNPVFFFFLFGVFFRNKCSKDHLAVSN